MADEFLDPEHGFAAFLLEVGTKPGPDYSLDRIDNDQGYKPGNITWTDRRTQQANRRPKRPAVTDLGFGTGLATRGGQGGVTRIFPSPLLVLNGRSQTLLAWAEELCISARTILQRFRRGWPIEQVLDPRLNNPWRRPRQNQSHLDGRDDA